MSKKSDMTYMEQVQYNQEQRNKYYAGVKKSIIKNLVISGILGFIVFLEHRSSDLFEMSFLWGPVVDIFVTGVLFASSLHHRTHLLNGETVKNIPLEIIMFATTMIPWFYTVWLRIGPAADWNFFTCIWMTPVTLVILIISTLYYTAKDPRFSQERGNEPLSIQEISFAKQNMKLAGLNPDKAGMLTSVAPDTVRSMSIQDWYTLGQQMDLAGYDGVFKK